MLKTYILEVLLVLSHYITPHLSLKICSCHGSTSSRNNHKNEMKSISDNSEDFSCNNVQDVYEEIECFPFPEKLLGNSEMDQHPSDKKFNIDANIECISCVSIANELSRIMEQYLKMYRRLSHKKIENFPLYPKLRRVCSENFIGYDLQRKGDKVLLAPSSLNGQHVPVKNINWKQKLEDSCLILVSHYGSENMYNEWSENSKHGLINELCRGSGIFGACQSIEEECYESHITNV